MHADLESILCKFGGDLAICLQEETICAKVYRRTTDRRRTPRHCIIAHSWNELIIITKVIIIIITRGVQQQRKPREAAAKYYPYSTFIISGLTKGK